MISALLRSPAERLTAEGLDATGALLEPTKALAAEGNRKIGITWISHLANTSLFPASGPATGSFTGLNAESIFLAQKPGRAEQRLLQIHEIAIRTMREQAPGFAPAWENALRQGEADSNASESGLTKLVRRVIPGLGNAPAGPSSLIVTEEPTDRP